MSWKGDPNAVHTVVDGEIAGLTEKGTPVDADLVMIEDSADSNSKKKAQLGNLPGGGGGGGGSNFPEWISYLAIRQADETSHADDDFFDDATLAGTALTVSGTADWAESRDLLSVLAAGQSASDMAARIYSMTPSTAPVTVETAVRYWAVAGDGGWVGVGFTDGATAADDTAVAATQYFSNGLYLKQAAGTFTNFAGSVNTSIHQLSPPVTIPLIYIRCVWSAADTFKASFSIDGVNYSRYGAGNMSKTLTPDRFFVFATSNGSSVDFPAAFEYIRVYESDEA